MTQDHEDVTRIQADHNEEILKNKDSNGLENFGIDEIEENTPDLFNPENSEEEFTSFNSEEKSDEEEDDLEIPAFLRRQKS